MTNSTDEADGLVMKINGKLGDVVYQDTSAQQANASTPSQPRRQRRRRVDTPNPNTPAQQIQRAKLREANQAWQALTETEKDVYRKEALGKSHPLRHRGTRPYLEGYTYFVSLHIQGRIA